MVKNTPYTYWRTIFFGDTDAAGVVYTPRFSEYCMEAAEFWFRECIGIDWYQRCAQNLATPVVHMELDFMEPLVGNDRLGVIVQVGKLGQTTLTLTMAGIMKDNNENLLTIFTAKYVFCFINSETRKPYNIPDDQRNLIETYRVSCERQ